MFNVQDENDPNDLERFKKAKSPLWTAAYYFDPMNLSGQNMNSIFTPPHVTDHEFKEVEAVLKPFVGDDPTGRKLAEVCGDLFKWKLVGCTAIEATALGGVCLGEKRTGAIPAMVYRRGAWERHFNAKLPLLAPFAARLLSMHAASCAPERNWSQWRLLYRPNRSSLHTERAEMMLSIASAAQVEANELRSMDEIEEEHDLLTMWEEDAPDEPQATC